MSVNINRRVIASRPVGRALGGQDRFEKESLEGPAEGGLAAARRQRMAGGTLRAGEESPFAARLRKLAGGTSDDER